MSQERVEAIRQQRCERCGIDLEKLWEMQATMAVIVEFLRKDRGTENVAITPDLQRNTIILDTLNWVLGVDRGGFFLGYMNALRKIRPDVLSLMRKPMDQAAKE